MCVESSHVWGLQRGDIGPFYENTDTTYKGTHPINTDGGQLSSGQLNPAGASGTQQTMEMVRQLRGEAASEMEGHQVPDANLGLAMY